jgi:AraC-like DNA-binding protein
MIYIFLSLLFFIAVISGFAVALLILFSRKKYSQKLFLSLFLFSLAVANIYNFYVSASMLNEYPHFFTLTKPFIFLVAPCAFIYLRNMLIPENKIRKLDFLHFVPFAYYFSISFLLTINAVFNYYGSSLDGIKIFFKDYAPHKMNTHFSLLAVSIWMGYAFCQSIMMMGFRFGKLKNTNQLTSEEIKWIRFFNLIVLSLFSILFVNRFLNISAQNVNFLHNIMISFTLLLISGWIYFKPQLFCSPVKESVTDDNDAAEEPKLFEINEVLTISRLLTDEKKQEYIAILDHVFLNKKLFLKKDLVIRDLSEESGIPVHHLSSLINSEFNLHFKDYVNLKRIDYFKDKINEPQWKDFSLEGMAWGSGFKSRTTCFRAFIKHTGKSPSEYFKEIRIIPEKSNMAS